MSDMIRMPLLMRYVCKTALWGGSALKTRFGKVSDLDRLAETWELSVREKENTCIANGPYAGMTLAEYLRRTGEDAVSPTYDGGRFPLLIKLIDAADRLSVQVHPSDAYAQAHEHDPGKTEMWYIVAAEQGAELIYGLKPGVRAADFAAAVRHGCVEKVLATRPVQAGECYFIPSGMVHAIGGGIVVAEIQQNSDLTYRVYDYDRVGADGKTRPLHREKAVDVTVAYTEETVAELRFSQGRKDPECLCNCAYFRVDRRTVRGVAEGCVQNVFHALLLTEGRGEVMQGETRLPLAAGDCCFLPAGMGDYTLRGECEVLDITLPG